MRTVRDWPKRTIRATVTRTDDKMGYIWATGADGDRYTFDQNAERTSPYWYRTIGATIDFIVYDHQLGDYMGGKYYLLTGDDCITSP